MKALVAPAMTAKNAAAAPAEADGNASPAMSKTQLKKMRKAKEFEEKKRARKEREKAERKEKTAQRRADAAAKKEAMTAEEIAEIRARSITNKQERREVKEERKAKMRDALKSGQRIIIDLEFSHLMTDSEMRSMTQQLSYTHSANTKAALPAHLIFTGVSGKMEEGMKQRVGGYLNWPVTCVAEPFARHFADSLQDLVYLTADSPNELNVLDPAKAYIVGGIVDRNRHKGLCFNKAEAQGVATARLPIGAHLQLSSSSVMTTNHVIEILLHWLELKDWAAACEKVVPPRKRKDAEPGGTQGGGGGGAEGQQQGGKKVKGETQEEVVEGGRGGEVGGAEAEVGALGADAANTVDAGAGS